MRALLQRVAHASVTVEGEVIGQTGPGLLILVCAMQGDGEAQADQLAAKIAKLRIFPRRGGQDEPLGARHGRRPRWSSASSPWPPTPAAATAPAFPPPRRRRRGSGFSNISPGNWPHRACRSRPGNSAPT